MYTANMIRTQIYIPEAIHQQLVNLATDQKKSIAELVRYFIEDGLTKRRIFDSSGTKVMQAIANMKIKKGPKDLSTNLDHYLYGAPKKRL